MNNASDIQETFQPRDRKEWREWLERNHATSRGVGLIYFKKASGKRNITLDEALLEALSFGWIDGRTNRLDEDRVMLRFSPRRKGSTWARSNKRRVEKLIEEGIMTPAGMAKVEEAKRNGSWHTMDDVDELLIPEDLARALEAHPPATENFDRYSDSQKKQLLGWLKSARRPDTRNRRMDAIVGLVLVSGRATDVVGQVASRSSKK